MRLFPFILSLVLRIHSCTALITYIFQTFPVSLDRYRSRFQDSVFAWIRAHCSHKKEALTICTANASSCTSDFQIYVLFTYFLSCHFSPDQAKYHRDHHIRQCISHRQIYLHQHPIQHKSDHPQDHIGDLYFFFTVIFF